MAAYFIAELWQLALRFRCGYLEGRCLREAQVERGSRPGCVSTVSSPSWAAASDAAMARPSPAPPLARVRAPSVR